MNRKNLPLLFKNFSERPIATYSSVISRLKIRVRRKLFAQDVILFERYSGIGDIICTFPSLIALRKKHPNSYFIYGVRKEFRKIVEMGQIADQIIDGDWITKTPKVLPQDCNLTFRPRLEDEFPTGREHVHLVDDFAQTLNVKLENRQPILHINDFFLKDIKRQISLLTSRSQYTFAIHIGPSWAVREWTVPGWTKLVKMINGRFNCSILQLGSDIDTAHGYVKTPRIPNTIDCIGKFSLSETVAAIKSIKVLIGIDSGLLHIAGAVGTPVIGLFGPINPELRLPPMTPSLAVTFPIDCLGCHHRQPILHWQENCPYSIACMKGITAEMVYESFNKLLYNIS